MNNNVVMTARLILASSSLLTLIFNDINKLIPKYNIERIKENAYGLEKINIFFHFENIYIPYFFSIIILILVIFGVLPRLICILHSIVSYSIFYSMLVQEGGDQINSILTFLLIPLCLANNKFIGWKYNFNDNKNYFFNYSVSASLLFIKIQFAILYLNAGISKVFQTEWANGTAVYYWFYNSVFGAPFWMREAIGFLFKNSFSVTMITWGVIFLEIFLSCAVFFKQKHKYIIFVLAFSFHFLIFLIHGLPTFWVSMTAGLVLYLFNINITFYENLNEIKKSFKSLV
jgi:antimicrobial peptide system SdpB family protein